MGRRSFGKTAVRRPRCGMNGESPQRRVRFGGLRKVLARCARIRPAHPEEMPRTGGNHDNRERSTHPVSRWTRVVHGLTRKPSAIEWSEPEQDAAKPAVAEDDAGAGMVAH